MTDRAPDRVTDRATNVIYLSPTDVGFYANHDTATLERLAERLKSDGAYVAMNSGADHPIARELAAILVAILGQLLIRDLDKLMAPDGA